MNVLNGGARERPAPDEGVGVLLDTFLPRYDFQERHSRVIAAPREAVWEAIEAVTLAEMPVVGALFALRSLPARLSGGPGLPQIQREPVLAQLPESGFVTLAEDRGRELVFGVIAQMWKRHGETAEIRDGADFLAFDRADFVKAAMTSASVTAAPALGSRPRPASSPPTPRRTAASVATGS